MNNDSITDVAPEGLQDQTAVNASEKYQLSMEGMLKAGVHFGHKKSNWNPKMKPFIFGVRGGVHVINLEKSQELFEKALDFMSEIISKGGKVLVIGTKKQAKDLVKAVADKIEMPYVNERWVGGTFTNYKIISKRVKYLTETSEALEKGKFAQLTKLEKLKLNRKLEKIEEKMGGLERMTGLPEAIFVLDIKKDELAVKEAKNLGIKVVGLVDTNCDPEEVDYPIPANDDALSSLRYILGVFLKKALEAKGSVAKKAEPTKNEELKK